MECRDLIRAIDGQAPCGPDFAAGLDIKRIIHAMAVSDGRPVNLKDRVHEDA